MLVAPAASPGAASGQRSQPLITACLIVRDEEANLTHCLASLDGLVDEIVAVDTGSTDRTVEILASAGATVREVAWANDFSLHRNQALDMASGAWVLVIDADEEVVETDGGETRARLQQDGLPDLLLTSLQLDYPDGRSIRTTAPRLFRNQTRLRFIHRVHEQLNVKDEPAALSNVKLRHHGYRDVALVKQKEMRNLALAQAMPPSAHAHHCVARAAFTLGEWDLVVRTADKLECASAPELLRLECAALAAAASLNLGRATDLQRFLEVVQELAPDSPDSQLLAALAALHRYVDTLRSSDSTAEGAIALRPSVFPHSHSAALRALQALHAGAHRRDSVSAAASSRNGAP